MSLDDDFYKYANSLTAAFNKVLVFSRMTTCGSSADILDTLKTINQALLAIAIGDTHYRIIKEHFIDDYKLNLALVHIVLNTEHLEIAEEAVDILSKIISKDGFFSEDVKKPVYIFFTKPEPFSQILRTLRSVETSVQFETFLSDLSSLQLRILRILEVLLSKRPRYQFSSVSEEEIDFIYYLIIEYKDSKDHAEILTQLVRQICRTKRFCKILGRRRFFDALYDIFNCTQQSDVISRIIRIIAKNSEVDEMKHSSKLCYLILNLVNNYSKTRVMKKYLIGILYKILKRAPEMISSQTIHEELMAFLRKHNNLEEKNFRMTIIKVYTLLNLHLEKKIIRRSSLNYELKLPPEVQRKLKYEVVDDSDNDNTEEEDFDNEDEDVKSNDDSESSDDEGSIISSVSSEDLAIVTSKSDTFNMAKYYQELVGPSDSHQRKEERLDIFQYVDEHISGQVPSDPNKIREAIFRYIHKPEYLVGCAYPDIVSAEGSPTDERLDFSIHQLEYAKLIEKLQKIKANEHCRKLYNLDDLVENKTENTDDNSRIEFCDNMENDFPKKKSRMMNDGNGIPSSESLEFESRFESGNLRTVEKVDDCEYNIYLSPDTSSLRGHRQWFYFEVSNTIAGKPYTFNIVNFDKINSQFNYGMQPVIFSVTNYLLKNIGWVRTGKQVLYYGNNFTDEDYDKSYRTLTFTITFEHNYDYCYIAYHYPYTYTKLMSELYFWQAETRKAQHMYTRIDNLCFTLYNNIMPLITITNTCGSCSIPYEDRPLVYIAARVHPGEPNSSWIMDGILKALQDENNEAAAIARENYIFKIIPMLNPDGCIFGNTRSALTGDDLNRCWRNPDKALHPEIYHTKKLVEYAKKTLKHPIGAFIDIHGHSRKKFFFFYGCDPAFSWNKKDQEKQDDFDYTAIPTEVSTHNKNLKLSLCHYRIDKHKEATARVVMWREFGIKNSFTLECSYCSGDDKKKMTTNMLQDIGKSIITALADIAIKKKQIVK